MPPNKKKTQTSHCCKRVNENVIIINLRNCTFLHFIICNKSYRNLNSLQFNPVKIIPS